jgi:hypothetical protein
MVAWYHHSLLQVGLHLDRVAFQSQERIICSVLDSDSDTCINCYEPYKLIVDSNPHAAYVCMLHSTEATAVANMVVLLKKRYRRMVLDGYVIYQPEAG